MIKIKKSERVIKAVGGLSQAKHILANIPDKTAFFFQTELGMYARTSMIAGGLMTSVFLGGRWVGWANPFDMIRLSDLRRAVMLFEKSEVLSVATNDESLALPVVPKFDLGNQVVYLDLASTSEVFRISELHINRKIGNSYILTADSGEKLKEVEGNIRAAMIQETIIRKRINHIDEALTVSEVEYIRGLGHA